MAPITNRRIYHFTDFGNIPKIVEAGGLRCDAYMARGAIGFTECADVGIKGARRMKRVPVHPYGFVGDYVPFYYAPRSPMMSAISYGSVPGYTDSKNLVYLVSSLEAVDSAGLTWACSDGNARTGTTQFFNSWTDLEGQTDWEIMGAKYWNNTETDGDCKRRRMAEFLVLDSFPLDLVNAIFVHSQGVADKIRSNLPSRLHPQVDSNLYI